MNVRMRELARPRCCLVCVSRLTAAIAAWIAHLVVFAALVAVRCDAPRLLLGPHASAHAVALAIIAASRLARRGCIYARRHRRRRRRYSRPGATRFLGASGLLVTASTCC